MLHHAPRNPVPTSSRLAVVAFALVASTAAAEQSSPPGPPAAPVPQDEETTTMARELAASGIELYEGGAYPEASRQLEEAYALVQVPTTGLWSARALDKTGNLMQAAERYREVLAMAEIPGEPVVFKGARDAAKQELDLLEPRIPKVVVKLKGATAQDVAITVDGVALAQEMIGVEFQVNPGERKIVGVLAERAERVTLALPERSTGSAVLDFSPVGSRVQEKETPIVANTSDAGGMDRATWGYIALGAGGAALVTGVIATTIANGQRSDLEANCPGDQCRPEFHGDVDALNSTLTLSFVGYLGAAVGIGAGSYLLLTDSEDAPASQTDTTVRMWVGPASVGVDGRF